MKSEAEFQKEVISYFEEKLPKDCFFMAVPDPSYSSIYKRNQALAGIKDGMPDLLILPKNHSGFFIELKRDVSNASLQKNQRMRMVEIYNSGRNTYVCRSLKDVQAVLSKELRK